AEMLKHHQRRRTRSAEAPVSEADALRVDNAGLSCLMRFGGRHDLPPASRESPGDPSPSLRVSIARAVFSSSFPRTRLPNTESTTPSARPLRFLPWRTTTASTSVVPSG